MRFGPSLFALGTVLVVTAIVIAGREAIQRIVVIRWGRTERVRLRNLGRRRRDMWRAIKARFGVSASPAAERPLERDEIIGSPIRRLRGSYRARGRDGWLDVANTYFTLESGVSFALPSSAQDTFWAAQVPRDASDLQEQFTRRIVGDRVAEAYRYLSEDEESGESVVLRLTSGLFLTETVVAPSGTATAGLHVYSPEEWDAVVREKTEDHTLLPFWEAK